ncbi:MAG: single-stranded-DNA-specific exonuclease RecJ [bacterium]|nr:single-stranded-DNA-specific exonuclease RecJ [bacterium]
MVRGEKMTSEGIIARLLTSRGLTKPQEVESFFRPPNPQDLPTPFDSQPAIDLINKHVKLNHKIAVYGDYDVDGICATAILWETLYSAYKNVFPHIPHREAEGYGLSTSGINHCLAKEAKLIIAVDNGIVAHDQIAYCQKNGCDIIIIDHHESDGELPPANVILHSVSACATALTWFFCRQLPPPYSLHPNSLELAAIATVCDIVPLLGTNRSIVKYGLEQLQQTQRPGLLALFEKAHIRPAQVGTYEVGFIIGPRLNAMGRLEHAIDSLRLLCTTSSSRARELALILDSTNRQRQTETELSLNHALDKLATLEPQGVLLSADASYHQGIIGLIAAKIVEKYWRPGLAVSIGETVSKGSGRSIPGFHLTNFLRQWPDLFMALGGHAMACGFTIATNRIDDLSRVLETAVIDPQLLVKKQRVDLDIPLSAVNLELCEKLNQLAPFGLGNPTPLFQSVGEISDVKPVGDRGKHLKFKVDHLEAIWFNSPPGFQSPTKAELIYSIEKDTWNGQEKLQLMVKEVKLAHE